MALIYSTLLPEALCLPTSAVEFHIGKGLRELYPGKALLATDTWKFDLTSYAEAGHCRLTPKPGCFSHILVNLEEDEDTPPTLKETPKHAWFEVEWQGQLLEVVTVEIECDTYSWLLADVLEIAERFFTEVCQWEEELHDELLVFNGEYWQKDPNLFKAIRSAHLDNLVLADGLKDEILQDLRQFFDSRLTYEEYGVPWKRGVILIGPPGNGKTHAVKALVNVLGKPCLYIKSFNSQKHTNQTIIRQVFERAREVAPCIMVMEDLDSLITRQNRSFFLNELDGFAANTGILVLATTNHPEKLDPAIVERPSRFDRKYHFNLPEVAERLSFIRQWNENLKPAMRLNVTAEQEVAEITGGFSFAYLKELFLSSTMRWFNQGANTEMGQVLAEQVALLSQQMSSSTNLPNVPETPADKDE